MKKKSIQIGVCCIFAVIAILISSSVLRSATAAGTTYHVATTGNDANSCAAAQSANTPKQTIKAGVSCATQADDIVNVHAGTYIESILINGHAQDGAAGSPKILQANPGDTVTWTSKDRYVCQNEQYVSGALFLNNVSYWRIQGFTFANSANYRTIGVNDTTNRATPIVGIEILNNKFINNGTNGMGSPRDLACDKGTTSGCTSYVIIMMGGLNSGAGPTVNTIAGNTFTDNYGFNIGGNHRHTLVERNVSTGNKGSRNGSNACNYTSAFSNLGDSYNVFQNNTISNVTTYAVPVDSNNWEGSGFRCDVGPHDNIIRNNVIHDMGSNLAPGTPVRNGFWGIFNEQGCNNNQYIENVIYNTYTGCFGADMRSSGSKIEIKNNTLYNCGLVGIELADAPNALIHNNIIAGPAIGNNSQVIVASPAISTGGNIFRNNDWYQAGSGFGCWPWTPGTQGLPCNATHLNLSQWVAKVNSKGQSDSCPSGNACQSTAEISADPLFVNASAGDFHLQPNSPAKGAGDDGRDMGAYPGGGGNTSSPTPTAPIPTPTFYCLGICPTLPVSPTSSIPPPSFPTTIQQNPSPIPPPPGGKNLIELLLEFIRSILEMLLKLLSLGQ